MLSALRRKMRANEAAMTAPMPNAWSPAGAVSRDEPQPKFRPPTMTSPRAAFFAKSGSWPSLMYGAMS
jgi:hypothetical protein